jgi:hypothetical protein
MPDRTWDITEHRISLQITHPITEVAMIRSSEGVLSLGIPVPRKHEIAAV